MEETYEQIKKMIADGFVEEAVAAARESMGGDNDAQLLYLMGNAYMKQGLRKEAMNATERRRKSTRKALPWRQDA